MSTSSFPSATRVIERYMTDTVLIERPQDVEDQAVHPDTMALLPDPATELYSGKALIAPMGDPGDQTLGLGNRNILYFTVALPVVDVDFQPDDLMTVTTAQADSQLQGAVLRIEGQIPSTISVYKRLRARLDVEAS